jgi:hypothetical protein
LFLKSYLKAGKKKYNRNGSITPEGGEEWQEVKANHQASV